MAIAIGIFQQKIDTLKSKLERYGAVDSALSSEIRNIESLYDEIVEECDGISALWETNCETLFETVVKLNELVHTALDKIELLQTENSEMKERVKELEDKVERLLKKTERMESDEHLLVLAQLAFEIDKAVAKNVLDPVLGNRKHFIQSIQDMENEIRGETRVFKSEVERSRAKERWTTLQEKLNWDSTLFYYMKTLKRNRISIAHPTINEKTIDIAMRKHIPEHERGVFKRLIEIYQELVHAADQQSTQHAARAL